MFIHLLIALAALPQTVTLESKLSEVKLPTVLGPAAPIDLGAPAIVLTHHAIWLSLTSVPTAPGNTLATLGPDNDDEYWNITQLEDALRGRLTRGARVTLFADSGETGNLLRRVLYSAEQVHAQVQMVVQTPQGRGGVAVSLVQPYTKRPVHRCILSEAQVTSNGWVPIARDVDDAGGGEFNGLSGGRPLARPVWNWSGRALLLKQERCPAPLEHLARFSDAFRFASDTCADPVVTFGDDVGIDAIATVVGQFAAGRADPVEVESTSGQDRPRDPCSGALPSTALADRSHERAPPQDQDPTARAQARASAQLLEAFGPSRGPVEVLPPGHE